MQPNFRLLNPNRSSGDGQVIYGRYSNFSAPLRLLSPPNPLRWASAGFSQTRATPLFLAASATALATAGHTRGSKAAGMM